jgi:hypothetical protein
MVTLNHIYSGAVRYIDTEITPKMSGWHRWAFGALSAVWLGNISNTFEKIKETPFVKSLGVINESDMIDIDKLYREFYAQAQKGPVTFDIPFAGPLTVDKTDVEKIYRHILEG